MKKKSKEAYFRWTAAVFLAVFLIGLSAYPAQAAVTANDGFAPDADSSVDTMAVQADGRILVGGWFTTIAGASRNYIARLNVDGSIDTSFNSNTDLAVDSPVQALVVQADGKILVGGMFTTIGGQTRNGLARLNSDGTVDTSFNPNAGLAAGAQIQTIAIQQDGNIVVGGYFTNSLYTACHNIARLAGTDGSIDSWFVAGANNYVNSIALQADGKIVLGGNFTSVTFGVSPATPYTRNYIARLNTDGTPDMGFTPGATGGGVNSVAVQVDGKILVGGNFTSIASTARNRIARLNSDGTIDTGFNPNAGSNVLAIVVQPDGKVLLGGQFTTMGGATTRNRMARLNQDGSLDTGFDPNVNGTITDVLCIVVQPDDKILAGGDFTTVGGTARNNIARLQRDGTLDATLNLNPATNGFIYATAVQGDGKILIGGGFTSITISGATTTRNNIARLNPDGSLDTGFNPDVDKAVYSIVVERDGDILIGGCFNTVGVTTRNGIARLNAAGTLDTAFNPDITFVLNVGIRTIALDWEDKILIGGWFGSVGGTTRHSIARLNADGSLDTAFDPNAGTLPVNSIAVLPYTTYPYDAKILIGGNFTQIGTTARNRLARLNADGSVDTAFNPNADGMVDAVLVQPDGNILVGGLFTKIGLIANPQHFAKLDAQGNVISGSTFDTNNEVYTIALQTDGKILVGGAFTTVGGVTRNGIARLNADGSIDTSFDPNATGSVYSIGVQADGKILAGGYFSAIGGQTRTNFARLTNTDAAIQELAIDSATQVTWKRSNAGPEVRDAWLSVSTDPTFTSASLSRATRIAGGWRITNMTLPVGQIFYVRARGFYPSGDYCGSGSVHETIRQGYFVPYTLTITKSGTGSGTVTSSPGTIIWSGNTGTASYGYNTSVWLYATASVGSTFAGWSGGGCAGTGTCTTLTMDADKSVTATFNVSTYTVTPSAGTGGTISPSTPQTVSYNATTALSVTPNTGYHIDSVTGCGGLLSGSTYTTGGITSDCTVTASFAINSYTVTPSAGTHGIILPTTAQSVNYGSTTTFTIMPEFGYHIDTVAGCGGLLSGQTYTTGAITTSCAVTASFAADPLNGVCGTADGQTFTTAPSTNLCVDGTATAVTGTGPWTWSCTGLNGGTTASCSANIQTYTVTPTAGANGSISPNTAQTVNYNGTTAFTITPANGYAIQSVTGCGGSMANANTYTTGAITANCTVMASFTNSPVNGACGSANGQTLTTAPSMNLCSSGTPGTVSGTGPWNWSCTGANGGTTASCSANLQTYTVAPSAGAGGTISPNTAQTVNYNGTKAFTVTPSTGYHISATGGTCGGTLSGNTYTTAAITANCTVTASFAINTYTVTPSAGANGTISPSTAQTVNYNGTKAFTVTPNANYHIASVTGCGGTLSGSTYTTGAITANCTVTATFGADTSTVPTGDLNGDGTVDATDALKALRIAAGIDTATAADLSKGDVAPLVSGTPHPDGKIDIGDVVVILRKAVRLISW